MSEIETRDKINSLTKRKKQLDKNRTMCGFLFCIFVFDFKKFLESEPSVIATVIYSIITIAPVAILIWECIKIGKINKQVKELEATLPEIEEVVLEEETEEEDVEMLEEDSSNSDSEKESSTENQ